MKYSQNDEMYKSYTECKTSCVTTERENKKILCGRMTNYKKNKFYSLNFAMEPEKRSDKVPLTLGLEALI